MLLLIVLILLLVPAGGYGYYRRADWGPAPYSVLWLIVVVFVLLALFGRAPF
jgi:hypothetical protein